MEKTIIKKVIKYWLETSENDYQTMLWLSKGKRYSDALFFGHIILEKILKALVVEQTNDQAPRIHNLTKLYELAQINISKTEESFLDEVNKYNIRCRYPDQKMTFYKMYNDKNYASEELEKIKKLYLKLCQETKKKIKKY